MNTQCKSAISTRRHEICAAPHDFSSVGHGSRSRAAVFPLLIAVLAAMPAAWASDTLTVSSDTVIDEDITVSNIVFTAGATLSGLGTITIDSTAGITVETGTATISNNVVFAAGSSYVVCTVGDDGILEQTGVWSGSSPIKLVGQGAAKANKAHKFFLRGANTFTGRLTLSKARVYAYGDGAFGASSGGVEWVQGGTTGSILYFGGGEWSDQFWLSGWQFSQWYETPITLAGTTNVFNNSFNLRQDAVNLPQFKANSLTVFAGGVTGGSEYAATLGAGAVVVVTNKNITTTCFKPLGTGTFYFYSALARSGSSGAEYCPRCRVVCMAEDRFNGSGTRGGYVAAGGEIDLNGYDQHGGALRGSTSTGIITSPTPATWYVNQGVAFTNANVFTDAVNLEKSGAARLGLSSASSTTGTLAVAEGEVAFTATGSWAGDMEVNAGSLIFSALTALEPSQTLRIADGAKVVLNGGYLTAQNVYYNGQRLAVGEYSAANGDEFVDGDYALNVVAAPVVAETATWTGEGVGDAIGMAANWGAGRETAPDFTAGLTTAVFAESGARAEVSGAAALNGIVFRPHDAGVASFTVAKAGDGASLDIGTYGIAIDDSSSSTGTYAIEPPVQSSVPVGISGRGAVHLKIAGKVFVTNAVLRASGTLSASSIAFTRVGSGTTAELVLSNATVLVGATYGNGVTLAASDYYYPLRALSGTTNRVEGHCLARGNVRPWFGANSETVFAGGCHWELYVIPSAQAGARIVFEGPLSGYDFNPEGAGTYVFRATGNKFASPNENYGCRVFLPAGVTARTEIANAFNYDFEKLVCNGTFDLAGCDQQFGPLAGSGTVASEGMAVLRVRQRTHRVEAPQISGATTNVVKFTGGASLRKTCDLDLWLAGASSTTGTIEVAEGVLGFANGGAWTNCSSVAVSGTGRLVIPAVNSFNRKADVLITAGSGAKVEIADGVAKICRNLYVNGELQPVGCYSSVTHGDWFSGGGVLRSTGNGLGMVLFVR